MFKCQHCQKNVGPNQPMNRVVVTRRERSYERPILYGPDRGRVETVYGWEIVVEHACCPTCFTEATGQEPVVVELPKVEKKQPQSFKKDYRRDRYDNRRDNRNKPNYDKSLEKVREREARDKRGDSFHPVEPRRPVVEVVAPLKSRR